MAPRRDFVHGEAAMLAFGAALAARLPAHGIVFLVGELGAGKTTLARGILRGLGFTGRVKSPTYTLVEPYGFSGIHVYHFDFYRINDPRELAFIGLDEILSSQALKLIEWPERAAGQLPEPDLVIHIREHIRDQDAGRIIEQDR
jgi:tRNA threonylcarbamoyladenosine biosynthesis protein TsaE